MREIVTICFAAILLALDLSLAVSLRRLIDNKSKVQGAVTAIVYAVAGAAAVFAGGMGSEKLYQAMRQTKWFSYVKTNFLSGSNPQMLYFLLYILFINFEIVIAGLLLWWLIDMLSRQPKIKRAAEKVKRAVISKLMARRSSSAGKNKSEQKQESKCVGTNATKTLEAPFVTVKVPPLAVLGKWLWNLGSALLILLFVEIVCGFIGVYLKIPDFSYGRKTQWAYGFFRVPILLSLVSVSFARALSYDAKRELEIRTSLENTTGIKAKTQKNADQNQDENAGRTAYERLLRGTNMRAPEGCNLTTFLPDYLYECFQRRRRVVVLCSNTGEADAWRVSLEHMLTGRFGEICLIRIGGSMHLKNREDIDVLVADVDEFLQEDLHRIWPFWFSQVGFVILSDTHPFLARTTQADVFFASWKQSVSKAASSSKKDKVQYLFLNCTMTAQEKEALAYYAGSEVVDAAMHKGLQEYKTSQEQETSAQKQNALQSASEHELVPWILVSPVGIYRRLLLLMQAENGVPESWLVKQKKRFGMEAVTTEDFLRRILSAVLPEYSVQNLYDSFSFEEEPGWAHGKWRVRLSDAAAEALLTRKDTEQTVAATGKRQEMLCLPDLVYEAEGMSPLGSSVYQGNKIIQIYQAQMKRTCVGAHFIAEAKNTDAYNHMIYEKYEEKSALRKTLEYEAVLLRLTIKCGESSERKQLEQMLSAVCNEVLQVVFPYSKGQITACYMEPDPIAQSGIVPRMNAAQKKVQMVQKAEQSQKTQKTQENAQEEPNKAQGVVQENKSKSQIYGDTLTIYLLENQSEQGLAAALHQNSSLFLRLCREWLERAINDSASKEAALVDYLMTEQRKDLMLPAASQSAGQIAGLAKLLVGLLNE